MKRQAKPLRKKDRKPDHKQLELIPGYRQTACQQHKKE